MSKTKWILDSTHSEIQFKVKHMMISTVTGHFGKFDAAVATEGNDFTTAQLSFTADIDSISTNNEQRDAHLKSEDFFDAANHPQLSFQSSRLEKLDDEHYKLHGTMSIRGISKPMVLNVAYGGTAKDPWGNERAGFEIEGKLNRKEFGLHWNAITEAGGLMVSDDVRLHAAAEFIKEVKTEEVALAA